MRTSVVRVNNGTIELNTFKTQKEAKKHFKLNSYYFVKIGDTFELSFFDLKKIYKVKQDTFVYVIDKHIYLTK